MLKINPKKSKPNMLIIEDDKDIINLLVRFFSEKNNVETASHSNEAIKKIKDKVFDVIVLDWMLDKEDGLLLGKKIRKTHDIPILMLTAKANKRDIITALDSGIDDYLTKPFSLAELEARITSLLRRNKKMLFKDTQIEINGSEINLKKHDPEKISESIVLTKTEYQILAYLLLHKDRAVSKEELDKSILHRAEGSESLINTHIFNLRNKIASELEIKTIPNYGFIIKCNSAVSNHCCKYINSGRQP